MSPNLHQGQVAGTRWDPVLYLKFSELEQELAGLKAPWGVAGHGSQDDRATAAAAGSPTV
jgi:hypothetical protein